MKGLRCSVLRHGDGIMKLSISKGNTKLGKLPNISLTPIKACGKGVPCKRECYALKSYKQYPNVRKNWDDNLKAYKTDPDAYFRAIDAWFDKHHPKFFRWHVAGDIVDKGYLAGMLEVARDNPNVKFLAFTKRGDLIPSYIPGNLQLIYSCWPATPIPTRAKKLRKAWVQDGTESRVPSDAIECPGDCEHCGLCFQLGKIGKDVVFHKH